LDDRRERALLDDPARLREERGRADRSFNDALTELDRAIQRLPLDFPHPPPGPDEHQITPLNTLWKLDARPAGGWRRVVFSVVRRAVGPLFEQQRAFNSAVVDHLNRALPVARRTRESIETTLAVLRAQIEELSRFESLLVVFLQQITPYVDTRDRDVAGLLRGLSAAIDAVADEMMKRTDALRARDLGREAEMAARLAAIEAQLHELRARLQPQSR
jgi:hypothetical protein